MLLVLLTALVTAEQASAFRSTIEAKQPLTTKYRVHGDRGSQCRPFGALRLSSSSSNWAEVSLEPDLEDLAALVAAQQREIEALKAEIAELALAFDEGKEKQDKALTEITELAEIISYQLDRALAVEQGAGPGSPLVEGEGEDDAPQARESGLWIPAAPEQQPAAAAGEKNPSTPRRPLPPASCRAMQTAVADGVRVGDAGPVKGLGAFALERGYAAGEVVGDYEGEWLSSRDLDARYPHTAAPLKPGDPPRPVPSLQDEAWKASRLRRGVGMTGDYIFGAGADIFVDGEDIEKSNWGRFINHAPETSPACNLRCKTLESDMYGNPKVWFVALRAIEPGEELLFDYGDNYWDEDEADA